jgi:hypothetical protein
MEIRPIPNPGAGDVLICVKASGSDAPSYSPDVPFRRMLRIEAVGLAEEADVGGFQSGHAVVSLEPRPICQRTADLRRGRLVKRAFPALPYGGAHFFQTRSFSRLRSRNRGQLPSPIPGARNRRCYTPIPGRHCD